MSSWHFVNIVLPVTLPPALSWALYLVHLSPAQRTRVAPWTSVKDGQLAWVALGMCLNGLYDLQHPAKALPASVSEWLLYSLVGVIVFSALLAALGPAPTSSRIRTGGLLQWLSTYRTFVASLFMTCGAAYLYATVHRLTQT